MDFEFGRPENYSPTVLAYLGDAVFELYVRSMLIGGANKPVNELNRQAREIVRAEAQAGMYHRVVEDLTAEEQAVLKRGRNARTTTSRSASVSDYRHATGLEALFGYLFITGDHERISWLFEKCIEGERHER